MVIILGSVLLWVFLSYTMRLKFRRWINYANVINLLWLIGIVTTAFGAFNVYKPREFVYIYIMIMLVCFNVITYLSVNNSYTNALSIVKPIVARNRFETVLLIFLIAIMLPELIEACKILISGGYNEVREGVLSSFTFTQWILYHYGNPIIIALSIMAVIDVVYYGKNKLNMILAFIAVIENITIFASRWMLTEIVLVLVISLLLKNRFRLSYTIKNNKKILIGVILAFALLVFITSQRRLNSGNTSILENIYYYFWGSVKCMDIHLQNVDAFIAKNGYTYGQVYFSGVIGLFQEFLEPILHTQLTSGIEIINQIVQDFVSVAPNIRMNNNVTMITAFYFDGGVIGIVLFSCVTASVVAWLYNKANKICTVDKMTYFIFAFSILIFGNVEWLPARPTIILSFLFMLILYKFRKIKFKIS